MATILTAFDYVVLCAVLLVSVGIGIYYASRQKTANEYFLADRSMHWLPVAVSISVSSISAITFLGTAALAYYAGPGYWVVILNRILSGAITAAVITPVFYNLRITSIYEYLEMRFNPGLRYIAVFVHIVSTFLMLGVVVYAPALALNAVSGINIAGSILAVGIICTFYSTIGGIKAVIWSDFFQSAIMIFGIILIIITAIVKTGGFVEVWSRATEGERTSLFFDFRLDPTIQLAFWPNLIGSIFLAIPYAGTNQNQAQRYLTCKDLRSAKYAVFWGFAITGLLELACVFIGFLLFAYYFGCDPLLNGEISKPDQIVPFFVVDVFGDISGLTGFLISAVFAASLSTFSTAINGLTAVTGEAFVKRFWPGLTDFKFTTIMKGVAVTYGIMFMLMAYIASVAGNSLIIIASRLIGALMGPTLGVLFLGMLVPRATSKGALAGILLGLALGIWLLVGFIVFPAPGGGGPPLFVDTCPAPSIFDIELMTDTLYETPGPIPIRPADTRAWIYRLSFLYSGMVTTVSTFLLGLMVSLVTYTKPADGTNVNIDLFSPVLISLYRKIPDTWKYKLTLQYETKESKEMKPVVEIGNDEKKQGEKNPGFQNVEI